MEDLRNAIGSPIVLVKKIVSNLQGVDLLLDSQNHTCGLGIFLVGADGSFDSGHPLCLCWQLGDDGREKREFV